ncbi:MAG: hypothetical protein JSV83_21245 [Desulfobacterales bacterium]|nr:MAG: hypothetical protein JSV83_21245 [Desulfobacterales bacterium]
MKARLKQYLLIAIIALAGYFILNHHIIFDGKQVYLLKKTSMHLHYTFYSIKQKKPETIMQVDILREAGVGDLLVELEKMTDEEKYKLESKYNY